MPADALSVSGVNTYYGASHVLHDVGFTLREGTVTGLLGRNGAGKTTTLYSINGFHAARSGSISLFGRSISGLAPEAISQAGLAIVPQGRRIFRSVTVMEHLRIASRRNSRFDTKTVFSWFPRLEERRDQLAGSLSGGEQQMLAIARAVVGGPRVILFDEPSEGLAPQIVEEVGSIIARLRDAGLTVLLVEQNTKFALRFCSDIVILKIGSVVYSGAADEAAVVDHIGIRS